MQDGVRTRVRQALDFSPRIFLGSSLMFNIKRHVALPPSQVLACHSHCHSRSFTTPLNLAMFEPPCLPSEILDQIIQILASDSDDAGAINSEAFKALQACSLTGSWSMLV